MSERWQQHKPGLLLFHAWTTDNYRARVSHLYIFLILIYFASLSSPFMDSSSASSFFDIILGLFAEFRPRHGGVASPPPPKLVGESVLWVPPCKILKWIVVLDEAHSYLTEDSSFSRLTESLLSLIRQQRHENMRVLISTQEPTVVPSKFLNLCSFVIAHRFSSPQWFKHLSKHVSSAESTSETWASKVGWIIP